jgi:hypothetical protein
MLVEIEESELHFQTVNDHGATVDHGTVRKEHQ